MPNLSFLHVSLNRDTPEGREIYDNLAKIPDRQRSMVVRAALLAYFRGEGDGEKRSRKARTKPAEPELNKQMQPDPPRAAPSESATPTGEDREPDRESGGPQQMTTTSANSENRLKDLLNLIL